MPTIKNQGLFTKWEKKCVCEIIDAKIEKYLFSGMSKTEKQPYINSLQQLRRKIRGQPTQHDVENKIAPMEAYLQNKRKKDHLKFLEKKTPIVIDGKLIIKTVGK